MGRPHTFAMLGALMSFFMAASVMVRCDELQPPIDRKAWMVSSPSQPLKVLKKPRYTSTSYPSLTDYMRVLERFPLYGERGWRGNYLGDPNLGFFADPDSAEMGMRSMGNYIFTMSLLSSDPAYDPAVTGISQAQVLSRTRSCLAYMTRSHLTGDITCGDGKKWGDHWQSAWWTAKMALGARLIWDKLTQEERDRVERVVVHEADRHLERMAPGGAISNTRSEENAWDTEVMTAAIGLFPNHPHAAAWRAKLIDFSLNTLSTREDRSSDAVVDGKALKDQVYTENVHSDYTIENHGAYHVCYMSCPLHSLSWGYYALTSAGQPVPQAQFHHFIDVWQRLKPTFLDRRFAYIEGKDWPRFAYGMYFIMPALVTLQYNFHDADARAIEARRFRTFEEEQIDNADGSFFGKRFTKNIMMDRQAEYDSDCYANLGVCYLLHKMNGGRFISKPADSELAKHLYGRQISKESEFMSVSSSAFFASFAWRTLSGAFPMALFIPAGMDTAAEWSNFNLVGTIDVDGVNTKKSEVRHVDSFEGDGFKTFGRIIFKMADESPAYTQEISFRASPKTRTAEVECRFIANASITVRAIEGVRLLVANDFFNAGKRTWRWDTGEKTISFNMNKTDPANETITLIPFASRWVNIDNKLGVIQLLAGGPEFTLRQSDKRNAPWGSIHYDVLGCPAREVINKTFSKGQEILHTHVLLVAGNAEETRAMIPRR